jgi:DNA (cytosine-5)-methyltransferase 1
VGKGVANTITTSCNQAVIEPKAAILRPKRTEYGKAIRKDYESGKVNESRHNMTKLEPVFDGVSNTITTVQKDNLLAVVEPKITLQMKKENERMSQQAKETFEQATNKKHGDIIQPYNKEYIINGISPTLTTRPEGFKTAILPVVRENTNNQAVVEPLTAQDVHGVLLAPDNWSHKAGDGTATRKHRETDIHPALTANPGSTQATYYKESNFRIRKLTPRECWRLQGFPDWAFERAAYGRELPTGWLDLLNNRMMTRNIWKEYRRITKKRLVSDSQLYKQAGNSVTVNVVYEIGKRLK